MLDDYRDFLVIWMYGIQILAVVGTIALLGGCGTLLWWVFN